VAATTAGADADGNGHMNCDFVVAESGELFVAECRRCGARVNVASPRPPVARCSAAGLGDYVAAGLSAVGITKKRVTAAIGRPCLCAERQAALNEIGRKYLGLPTGTRG